MTFPHPQALSPRRDDSPPLSQVSERVFRAPFSGALAMNFNAAEFMQYRSPVGGGPSSKTCPRCASHRAHRTSVRSINSVWSARVTIFSGAIGFQKLGHPVPESNLASELNSAVPQQTHRYSPLARNSSYSFVNGRSVPPWRVT